MNMTITVDKAGRIVIPQAVRDRLHLVAGSQLILKLVGEHIELRHKPETARVAKKGKLRVIVGGDAFHAGEAILADREEHVARVASRFTKRGRH
jgi:AbrB family looped-hinge helix DNA binding protein